MTLNTSLDVLCSLLGYDGGTVHDLAREAGVSVDDVLTGRDLGVHDRTNVERLLAEVRADVHLPRKGYVTIVALPLDNPIRLFNSIYISKEPIPKRYRVGVARVAL